MGIHDRDYYRDSYEDSGPVGFRSAVVILLTAIGLTWFAQIIVDVPGSGNHLTEFLSCRPVDLVAGEPIPHVWTLVTAVFAHDRESYLHVLSNAIAIFFFGREVERRVGSRRLTQLFFVAGVLSILAESVVLWLGGKAEATVLGASGSALAFAVYFAALDPRRVIYIWFVPVQAWLLCTIFVAWDFIGALLPSNGVAHVAHLAGAGCGLWFGRRHVDWSRLRLGRWRRRVYVRREDARQPVARPVVRVPERAAQSARAEGSGEPDVAAVSARIDELLAKIHDQGIGSLSPDELSFLQSNSRRYRSSS
jgi:membrane associated rhomboid family serine protease